MRRGRGLRSISITARLRIVFSTIVFLMLAGSAVSFWHFRNVTGFADKVARAERRLTAVLRINNELLALVNQLTRAADRQRSEEFRAESARLLKRFQTQASGTITALEEIGHEDDYSVLIGGIVGMLEVLPDRISSLAEFADNGDWTALRARLMNEVDETDDVVAALMNRLDADLAGARKRMTDDLTSAQDRAVKTLIATASLSLTIAILLGAAVMASLRDPLSKLDRAAHALMAGEFSYRIQVDGEDELSEVSHAFNQMAGELERLFNEVKKEHRVAEAAQAELRERARQLARANADLEQFAYSASHDLQEPLRTITLYSQLLRKKWRTNLDADSEQTLNFVIEAARHMQHLISDLLAYTKSGHIPREITAPVDMNQALQGVLRSLGAQIETERCTVKADRLPAVRAHEVHVQQLLQNLLSNAMKYRSEERAPVIEIHAERSGDRWEIAVRDNGIGIEPQYTKQIFGIFKRLHARKYSGTGIGLAICQKIVESYGGQIWVESEPGWSSTFRFTLPATDAAFTQGA